MYAVINANIRAILEVLGRTGRRIPQYHVAEYQWLLNNLATPWPADYEDRYRKYWGMNPHFHAIARPAYFSLLRTAAAHAPVRYASALMAFHPISGRVEASFISKLCHMCDRSMPIVDRYISDFFFFERPSNALPVRDRVAMFDQFYRFLQAEYARVLVTGVLAPAINAFRVAFPGNGGAFTDEKIIDSLIWGCPQIVGATGGISSVTVYPFIPIVPGMTPRQMNGVFRRLQKQIEKRRNKGEQIREIVLRSDPNGVPVPDWFRKWCEDAGIKIVFIENDIGGGLANGEIDVPGWMRRAVQKLGAH